MSEIIFNKQNILNNIPTNKYEISSNIKNKIIEIIIGEKRNINNKRI